MIPIVIVNKHHFEMDISIQGLSKSYGFQKAVDNISFEVRTGEIVGFLGPNGAGKTTTMKMITGYLDMDGGDILIGGKSVRSNNTKKHIGYLPEHNPLYHEMPVLEYLEFSAAIQGVPKAAIPERVRKMVQVCGLDVEKHKTIGELSKGYRQRVGLAQALIHDPEILILDEPTTGLDPNQIIEIRELIKDIGKQKTVILSTHILPEVEATCDRILIINKGRIVADGTAESLRTQAQGKQVLKIRIEGSMDAMKALEKLKALETVDDATILDADALRFEIHSKADTTANRSIFEWCVKNNLVLAEMIPFETKLEDIFHNLTMN
ncbi:MAG: ATP-binding cassette domain-containing protein [Saprospiraceae bacterium]